jgi:dihydroorotase
LEAFTSAHGAAFYHLPANDGTLHLTRREAPETYPEKILTEAGPVTVFNPGFPVHWHVQG